MMDRRDALLLVERLKRRTRDPDVLTLCEYVHGTDVHGDNLGIPAAGCLRQTESQPEVLLAHSGALRQRSFRSEADID
jgi:hypothetical protein